MSYALILGGFFYKNSGAHSRVATLIQPSFQKKKKKVPPPFLMYRPFLTPTPHSSQPLPPAMPPPPTHHAPAVLEGLMEEAGRITQELKQYIEQGVAQGAWTSGLRDKHLEHVTGVDNIHRLLKKTVTEHHFLRTLANSPSDSNATRTLSTNLVVFRGILEVLKRGLHGVAGVQKMFTTQDKRTNVEVDIISGNGANWVKVKGTSSRNLEQSLKGTNRFGERNILELAEDMHEVASQNRVHFGAPNCFIVLSSAVDSILLEKIREQSKVSVLTLSEVHKINDCVHLNVQLKAEQELAEEMGEGMDSDSDMSSAGTPSFLPPSIDPMYVQRVNLDITALFALTSDLTNGSNHYAFPNYKVLDQQARDDRVTPVLPLLQAYLESPKKYVIACQTVVKEFLSIVDQVAGEEEKERATALLATVNIVPDSPSPRATGLAESGRVKRRQKLVFGTGDTYEAVTLTANVQFVQAAADQGVPFTVFVHPARALTEQKRLKEPISE